MLKFLRNKNSAMLFAAGVLCAHVSAQDRACIYSAQRESRPPGVISAVKSKDSASYFLRSGAYVNVVSWSCTRLGKRLLIVVPSSSDNPKYVESVLVAIGGKEIATAFKDVLEKATEKYGATRSDVKIDGYESASIDLQKDEYESRYVVTYYTSD